MTIAEAKSAVVNKTPVKYADLTRIYIINAILTQYDEQKHEFWHSLELHEIADRREYNLSVDRVICVIRAGLSEVSI